VDCVAPIEDGTVVGFAGMVPAEPFPSVGYLNRAYFLPAHRKQGLHLCFLREREGRARELGWTASASEVAADNGPSIRSPKRPDTNDVIRTGRLAEQNSIYFVKRIA
jgi:GNAT superfamily N-acetyltransferase